MIAGAFSSTSGKADTVLTTSGDVLYYTSSRQRLPIGDEGQVLTVSDADLPAWEATGGLSSPLTADLVYNDDVEAQFGTGGGDSAIYHDGTNFYQKVTTGYGIFTGDFTMAPNKTMTNNRSTATISSGAVTGNTNVMSVDTENSESTDDLTVADYSADSLTGAFFGLTSASGSRTVVIKANATPNPKFLLSADFSLDNPSDFAYFAAVNGLLHNYGIAVSNNA